MKESLLEQVQEMSPTQLSRVVEIIQQGCPNAFKQLDKERHQILVDVLDKKTFSEIQAYYDHQLKKKKLKSK